MPTQKLHRMNLRIPVLSRMADDVQNGGSLRRSTAILMWSAYAAHAAVTVWALAKPDKQLKSPRWAIPVGWAAAAGGAGLCVAAMSRFASAAEVEGTRNDALATRGIYRYSRNPQYLGYVVALGGAAVGRRSLTAAGLTAAIAGAYALWVPVEEQQVEVLYGEDYRRYVREVRRWWGRRL